MEVLNSRLLLIYDLAALAATLLFLWMICSQFVVIRHHARLFRMPAREGPSMPPSAEEAGGASLVAAPPETPEGAPPKTGPASDLSPEETSSEGRIRI